MAAKLRLGHQQSTFNHTVKGRVETHEGIAMIGGLSTSQIHVPDFEKNQLFHLHEGRFASLLGISRTLLSSEPKSEHF